MRLKMKLSINRKLILNILLFVVMIGIIIFVVRDSLSDIFTELGRTSLPVLIGVTGLGLISQLIEGYTIKNIAGEFNTAFTVRDGFCIGLCDFLSCHYFWYWIDCV